MPYTLPITDEPTKEKKHLVRSYTSWDGTCSVEGVRTLRYQKIASDRKQTDDEGLPWKV